jgi:hypothetical protein
MSRILFAALLAISVPAAAQPAEFRAAYERGMTHFHAKNFAKARAEFLAAFAILPEPTVLFAVAQAYRFEGNFKEAIAWYQKFLGESQAAQDLRAEAQQYLQEAEARQKQLDESRDARAAVGPKEPDGRPATMPDGSSTGASIEEDASDDGADASGEGARRIPLGSKIAAGVTGVGLVTAIVLTKVGLGVERDFHALRDRDMATSADADRVERYQHGINIAWGVTAAAAVASVAIYVLAPSYATDDRQVVVAPTGDGGWTAGMTARF